MKFLAPDGPCRVGSVSCRLVDPARPAHLAGRAAGRALHIKIWYPCRAADHAPERLWEELRGDPRTPAPMRLMLALSRTRTSSRPGAPLDRSAALRSLVVYNHGLVSFASENTSLMEQLASFGHIALAIRHVDQVAELQGLNRGRSSQEKRLDREWQRRLQAAPRDDKAALVVEYYARSHNTNRIVIERALDTSFVLDRVGEILRHVPGFHEDDLGFGEAEGLPIHLVGFSVGGAVAHEAAARDDRAASVVNLDGGLYGTQPPRPVERPYLMMYSSPNDGLNDALLPEHAERRSPAGTTHLSYHDMSLLWPWLRYVGIIGKARPRTFLAERNRSVERFIEAAGRRPHLSAAQRGAEASP